MPLEHMKCGLSVILCFRVISALGFHKRRAALDKVIKVIEKLISLHD